MMARYFADTASRWHHTMKLVVDGDEIWDRMADGWNVYHVGPDLVAVLDRFTTEPPPTSHSDPYA